MADIKDGDIRVFPYYKDTYLGAENTGFINKKSAVKYHQVIPSHYVYADGLNTTKEEYEKTHETISVFNRKEDGSIDAEMIQGLYHIRTDYYVNTSKCDSQGNIVYNYHKVRVNTLPQELQDKIHEFNKDAYVKGALYKFQEETGFCDHSYIDNDDYNKAEEKLNRNIEYRLGKIHLTVDFDIPENKENKEK